MERQYCGSENINTVYFGGGTPSLLEAAELDHLLQAIFLHYPVATDAEITLEANPDDITRDALSNWKKLGVNRLSMGIQSFFEDELRWMNRAHNAHQAETGLGMAREQFENITIDLIYGSPLSTPERWQQNVEKALSFKVPHISAYALTVEEKTLLHKKIHAGELPDVNTELQADQFLQLVTWLQQAGFEHYEVSNFAKPGFRSRHNTSYWRGTRYLGLGPSAHSFNGNERRWNIPHNQKYITGVATGNPAREVEVLTNVQKLNEYLMIGLRTAEGIDLKIVEKDWGSQVALDISGKFRDGINPSYFQYHNSVIRLTREGMLHADGIAATVFL